MSSFESLSKATFLWWRSKVQLEAEPPGSELIDGLQDFMRLYQAMLLLSAQVAAEGGQPPKLTDWLHEYAVRSFKDKVCLQYRPTSIRKVTCCLDLINLSDQDHTIIHPTVIALADSNSAPLPLYLILPSVLQIKNQCWACYWLADSSWHGGLSYTFNFALSNTEEHRLSIWHGTRTLLLLKVYSAKTLHARHK